MYVHPMDNRWYEAIAKLINDRRQLLPNTILYSTDNRWHAAIAALPGDRIKLQFCMILNSMDNYCHATIEEPLNDRPWPLTGTYKCRIERRDLAAT